MRGIGPLRVISVSWGSAPPDPAATPPSGLAGILTSWRAPLLPSMMVTICSAGPAGAAPPGDGFSWGGGGFCAASRVGGGVGTGALGRESLPGSAPGAAGGFLVASPSTDTPALTTAIGSPPNGSLPKAPAEECDEDC